MSDVPSNSEETVLISASQDRVSSSGPVETPLIWGHLTILEQVGAGGFGVVYRAWDPTLEREVALKLLNRKFSENVCLKEEGRLLARLRHPNVVTVYGCDTHGGRTGLWQEFIHGRTLSHVIAKHGSFGAREAVTVGSEVCLALAAVHKAGLVHRDVKAQNVMREDGGRIVLMDFGLGLESNAKTKVTEIAGTPGYMAPEILRGERATVSSDIYAVGVLLYFLVTASYPIDDSGSPQLLQDVRQDLPIGYVRVVERALALKAEDRFRTAGELLQALTAVHAESSISTPPARTGLARRTLSIAASLLMVVMLIVLWSTRRGAGLRGGNGQESIAVLPFRNLSGSPENEYLAEGIAEELVDELSRSGNLHVIARASTRQFQQPGVSPQVAGEKLRVASVLTGSVRRSGERIRVSAQLVHTADGMQVWSDVYEYPLKDVFAAEKEISRAVASALRIKLSKSNSPGTNSISGEAHDLYMQGRFYANKNSPANLTKGIAYCEQALQRDPNYAAAYAGLSRAYTSLAVKNLSSVDLTTKARKAADKALSLNNRSAEAHASLGYLKEIYDWDWEGAEKEFRLAIECNSKDVEARLLYWGLLRNLERYQESRVQLEAAEKLDPLSPTVTHYGSLQLFGEGRFSEARQRIQKVLAETPDQPDAHMVLGMIEFQQGHREAGLAEFRRAQEISKSPFTKSRLGWACAVAGKQGEARAILKEMEQATTLGAASPFHVAILYGALGELNSGFLRMDQAAGVHDPALAQMRVTPLFDPFRKDPRFETLLAKVGLN